MTAWETYRPCLFLICSIFKNMVEGRANRMEARHVS